MESAGIGWHDDSPHGWAGLLAADPSASPAHADAFRAALAGTLPGFRAATVGIARDGVLIGGAPVYFERRAGFTALHASPWLLPGTALARPGHHAEVDLAVAAAIAEQARLQRVIGGEWVVYRPAGAPPDAAALERIGGETRVLHAGVVGLETGIEAAWRRLGRHARQDLSAARRRGIACAEEPDALELAHALYATQARTWHAHRPLPIELARRLLATAAARLFVARDARGPLAAVLVLTGEHEWFAWWSGSHPDARRRHAFPWLLWCVAETAAQHGVPRLNVGASAGRAGVEAFKRTLGARAVPVHVRWLDARHAPLAGRVVAALQTRLRRGRARGADA